MLRCPNWVRTGPSAGRSPMSASCRKLTSVVFACPCLHIVDEAVRSSAQPSRGVVEVGLEMRAQIASIVTSAVNQRGLAAPQELHPHEVDARGADDSTVMRDIAFTVENWQL